MIISRDNAEHYVWGTACDGWHLVRGAELSVIHERMPPGTAETRHHHAKARQFFFVLAGVATMELDGTTHVIPAGAGLEVPPGARHQMRNDSEAPLELLVVSQPTTRGDRIDERT
jgi:mannose-6-phosphate isomerase-like protein (cupin superfamily)